MLERMHPPYNCSATFGQVKLQRLQSLLGLALNDTLVLVSSADLDAMYQVAWKDFPMRGCRN